MQRSQINAIMKDALKFMKGMNFVLPPFATWTPAQWRRKGAECRSIARQQLGWDITDFGSGRFDEVGLFLFTIRNGTLGDNADPLGKTYAEKIMIVREGQVTPTHFHFQKMEDIINRGGGELIVQMWNSTPEEGLADTPVTVMKDGLETNLKAGGKITLKPGESVTLRQRLYHKFWGRPGGGPVLVGEVSRVNDDRIDNRFLDPAGRFPAIEEDTAPLHLLVTDYARFYRG